MTPTLERQLQLRQRPVGVRPAMYQTWRDLVFLHWQFPAAAIQQTLPPGLTVDTYDGRAFVAVVPFLMRNIRPRRLPAVPWLSHFHEMNVRTYVVDRNGNPGVWFYSLDADRWPAVRIGRAKFHLPYRHALMSARGTETVDYTVRRRGDARSTHLQYRFGAELGPAEPGSLEFFLAERYVMFTYDVRRARLFSGLVHHSPYPLCTVDCARHDEVALSQAGFDRAARPPDHVIGSRGVDVDVFALAPLVVNAS